MKDMGERIAKLEQRVEDGEAVRSEMKQSIANIDSNVDRICNRLSRYDGKLGGILLMATLIWSGAMMFKDNIVHWFTQGGAP